MDAKHEKIVGKIRDFFFRLHLKVSVYWSLKVLAKVNEKKSWLFPTVCANPITVICPVTSTVIDPINQMENPHTAAMIYIEWFHINSSFDSFQYKGFVDFVMFSSQPSESVINIVKKAGKQ